MWSPTPIGSLIEMEFAASTLHLLDRPLEQALPDILSLSTRNIEIADSGNHSLSPERVKTLNELRLSHGLSFSVHAPFADTNLSADDDLIRDWILRRIGATLGYASDLDARCVVVHPGWTTATEKFSKGRGWELNILSLRRLLGYAEEYGVSLLIENVPEPTPYLLVSVDDFDIFYDELGQQMDMVLDVAHANLQGEVYEFMDRHGGRVKHIHVSDNHGSVDQHLPVGDGCIDWGRVLRAAEDKGFSGWIVVESYSDVERSLGHLRSLV